MTPVVSIISQLIEFVDAHNEGLAVLFIVWLVFRLVRS